MPIDIPTTAISSAMIEQHLLKKELGLAQQLATQSLQRAESENDPAETLEKLLLLSQALYTKGYYQNQQSLFDKASTSLDRAKKLVREEDFASSFDWHGHRGRHYLYSGQNEKAMAVFQQQLQIAQAWLSSEHVIISKLNLGECAMMQNQFNQALAFAQEGNEYLQGDEPELSSKIYTLLSRIHVKRQDLSATLKYSKKLLPLSRQLGDVEKELIAMENLAIVAASKADYKEAMELFIEVLEKSKEIGFRQITAQSLLNIATVYANLYNYNEALDRFQDALSDYEDVFSPNIWSITLNNVGNVYFSKGDNDQALEHFVRAYDLARDYRYKNLEAHTLAQISRVLTAKNQLGEALEKALEAQQKIDQLGEISGRQINLINLGEIHLKKGQYEEAIKYLSKGSILAKGADDNASEIRAYRLLANVMEAQGEYPKALDYLKVFANLQERFSEVHRNRQALDLEIKYSIKEKQKAYEALKKENEYQAILLKNKDQIARQNEQLKEANEELKQFASVASHDLKEPLRMIGSYTQLIEKQFHDQADAETQSYFDYISGGVKRMNALLDALLQYATIGRANETRTEVNLRDVVDICNLHLRVKIEETGARIVQENLPTIRASRPRMMQLFQNLLSNAIKFKQPGVRPIIHIRGEERETDFQISVEDNGIGIPPEFKDRIFVIFQRLHSAQAYEGTGIGLAVCYKIVKKMGGNIWVESAPGQGTCFHFTIPKS